MTVEGLGEGVKKGLLHLQVLAVHPEFHRKGLGAALVNEMVKQVRALVPIGFAFGLLQYLILFRLTPRANRHVWRQPRIPT